MAELIKSVQDMLHPRILLHNTYLLAILIAFLGMYGPHLHIRLPPAVRHLFDNAVFRVVVLFMIAYLAHRDFSSAITLTLVYVITINLLHHVRVLDSVAQQATAEAFSAYGPPVAECSAYEEGSKTANTFYPLHDNDKATKLREGNDDMPLYNATF